MQNKMLDFVSKLGSSARLRAMSDAELKAEMDAAELPQELQHAILSRDTDALVKVLRTSGDIVCCVAPDKPDEDEQEDEDSEEVKQAANG